MQRKNYCKSLSKHGSLFSSLLTKRFKFGKDYIIVCIISAFGFFRRMVTKGKLSNCFSLLCIKEFAFWIPETKNCLKLRPVRRKINDKLNSKLLIEN